MLIAERVVLLIGAAFIMNLPLGYLRAGARKFSFKWLFYIHASIPFIVIIRLGMGISFWYIPFSLGSAVAGQIVGARLRKPREKEV